MTKKNEDGGWVAVPQPEVMTRRRGDYDLLVSESEDVSLRWDWEIVDGADYDDEEEDDDNNHIIASGHCRGDTEDEAKEKAMACALAVLDVLCPNAPGVR